MTRVRALLLSLTLAGSCAFTHKPVGLVTWVGPGVYRVSTPLGNDALLDLAWDVCLGGPFRAFDLVTGERVAELRPPDKTLRATPLFESRRFTVLYVVCR